MLHKIINFVPYFIFIAPLSHSIIQIINQFCTIKNVKCSLKSSLFSIKYKKKTFKKLRMLHQSYGKWTLNISRSQKIWRSTYLRSLNSSCLRLKGKMQVIQQCSDCFNTEHSFFGFGLNSQIRRFWIYLIYIIIDIYYNYSILYSSLK